MQAQGGVMAKLATAGNQKKILSNQARLERNQKRIIANQLRILKKLSK